MNHRLFLTTQSPESNFLLKQNYVFRHSDKKPSRCYVSPYSHRETPLSQETVLDPHGASPFPLFTVSSTFTFSQTPFQAALIAVGTIGPYSWDIWLLVLMFPYLAGWLNDYIWIPEPIFENELVELNKSKAVFSFSILRVSSCLTIRPALLWSSC